MASEQGLPETHRALVLTSTSEPPTVKTIPTPQPTPGSAIVRILCANVIQYMRGIYDGTRQHAFPTPLVMGTSAIGRVAAVGPDSTLLTPGQLVYFDSTIRGRDDPQAVCLSGIHEGFTDGSRKLMRGEWRDSTYAQYAKVPLENCAPLDEERLLGMGYSIDDLAYIATLVVPYAGLRDINLSAGETVVIAPATGNFGGAAVLVALAMGARVIAMGRNVDALRKLKTRSERIEIVPITGDVQADLEALKRFGPIDAFFDISPAEAAKSTHIKSCTLALRHGGRVSLMGGLHVDVAFPYYAIIQRDLQLRGKFMFDRETLAALVKMVERGVLRMDARVVGKFGLEDWSQAFSVAAENTGVGAVTLLVP